MNPQVQMEHPPRNLGTEEFIEFATLPLADLHARLKERGVQFAGNYDLKWIKGNPGKPEAQRYKTGGEFYFFETGDKAGDGHYVRRLRWIQNPKDPARGEFEEKTIHITGMTAPIIWGGNRDQVDAIPRRVVYQAV